jgi:hypothetical protein
MLFIIVVCLIVGLTSRHTHGSSFWWKDPNVEKPGKTSGGIPGSGGEWVVIEEW